MYTIDWLKGIYSEEKAPAHKQTRDYDRIHIEAGSHGGRQVDSSIWEGCLQVYSWSRIMDNWLNAGVTSDNCHKCRRDKMQGQCRDGLSTFIPIKHISYLHYYSCASYLLFNMAKFQTCNSLKQMSPLLGEICQWPYSTP